MNPIPLQIETARLHLRAPQLHDAPALLAAVRESLPELRCWLPWANQHYDQEEARRWLIAAHDVREVELGYPFLLWEADQNLVGACGLQNFDESVPCIEIGYWLRTSARHRGLMTEAIAAITEVAFENLGALRVEMSCDLRNQASASVARRAGFLQEAHLKNERRDHFGVLSDTLIFARTKEEN